MHKVHRTKIRLVKLLLRGNLLSHYHFCCVAIKLSDQNWTWIDLSFDTLSNMHVELFKLQLFFIFRCIELY